MGVITGSVLNFNPYTTPLNDPQISLTNSSWYNDEAAGAK